MSTPLIILASILAIFAIVLIPLMMFKSGQQKDHGQRHSHDKQVKQHHKKKKKR